MRKESFSRKLFLFCNGVALAIVCLLIVIPLWNVLITSFAEDKDVMDAYLLIPKSFTFRSYERIFRTNYYIGLKNSFILTFVGTIVSLVFTVPLAYALAQKNLKGRKAMMNMILATYILDAGLIPSYMLMKYLGLIDSMWALIMASCVSTYNLILLRNYFGSLPDGLIESGRLDGASELRILFSIVVPISKPVFAVITLFYMVGYWNKYIDAVMYINDSRKYTIQVMLRMLMFEGNTATNVNLINYDNFKMAVMMVAILPVTLVYLLVQRYFVTGIMMGAVKE